MRLSSLVDLRVYAARRRWEMEVGGIVVDGHAVDTSRESQAMITGAHAFALAHPEASISYKATSGFAVVTAATMSAIATAVAVHVQACFASECAVLAAIDAGTVTTPAQVDAAFADISAPWQP